MKPTDVYQPSPTAVWVRTADNGTGFPRYVVSVNDGNVTVQGEHGKADIPKNLVPWLIEALTAAAAWEP